MTLFVDRDFHPAVWWIWAAAMAVTVTRSNNMIYSAMAILVAAVVVSHFRGSQPWARAFGVAMTIASVVLALRLTVGLLLGVPTPGRTLFTIPRIQLPEWFAGIRLGGAVTTERLGAVLSEGLAIVALIAAIGAATALTNPRRLLHVLPGAVHEAGVAVVVATTFTPQLVMSARRVQEARHLRGHDTRGMRGLRGIARPILEDAMDRAIALGTAMESRGYGRISGRDDRTLTTVYLLGGLVAMALGTYGLLAVGLPMLFNIGLFAIGVGSAVYAMRVAGRRTSRSIYRPDVWAAPENFIIAPVTLSAALLIIWPSTSLRVSYSESLLPTIEVLPLLLIAFAALPIIFLKKVQT
jgi:energy-coupling factor transport system permease protein